MRKIFASLLAALMLAVTVSAQAPFVEDTSGLLSPTAVEDLETQFSQLHEAYGFTVSVVTMPSLGGETAAQAAKNAYVTNGYGNDGIMLYICEDEGMWYIYTSGLCSQVLPDSLLTQVGETITKQMQAGNYYDAIQIFHQSTTRPIIDACNDNAAQTADVLSKNGRLLIWGLLGGLVAGIAIAVALGKLAKKPLPKAKEPEPEPETVPPVFEVQIPDLTDDKTP